MGAHATTRPSIKSTPQDILDSIRRLVQELRVADREAETELGLTGAQLFVLRKLSEDPVMSVNDLAERTCTDQSSVSVVVHRLVDKGLVKRQESLTDRRRAELSLTGAGRKLLSHVQAPHSPQDRLIETIESMTARNRQQLATLLLHVVDGMGLSRQQPAMFFEAESKPADRTRKKAR
jgi:DNA-binding MarR family transcriptional regulator